MKYILAFILVLCSACGTAPKITTEKGAVYGTITADSHPEFIKKIRTSSSDELSIYVNNSDGSIVYKDNMVNYSKLKEMYVGLVTPEYSPQKHDLTVSHNNIVPSAIALSPNDTLRITNKTATPQNFFISSLDDDQLFQSFPVVDVNKTTAFSVHLEGHLVLQSEENENLKVYLFSKKNMLSQKLFSGQPYSFEHLTPGAYQLVFWYWRLGKITQRIHINAEENLHINKVLTVESVIKSH